MTTTRLEILLIAPYKNGLKNRTLCWDGCRVIKSFFVSLRNLRTLTSTFYEQKNSNLIHANFVSAGSLSPDSLSTLCEQHFLERNLLKGKFMAGSLVVKSKAYGMIAFFHLKSSYLPSRIPWKQWGQKDSGGNGDFPMLFRVPKLVTEMLPGIMSTKNINGRFENNKKAEYVPILKFLQK